MSIHKPYMHVCTHVHTHDCAHVLRACLYVCLYPCRACMPTPMSAHMLYSYMRINRRHFRARMSTHEPTHMRTSVTARLPMRMPARMLRMRKLPHARACVVAHAYHAHRVHHLCAHVHRARVRARAAYRGGPQLRRAMQQETGAFVVGCLLSAAAAGRGRAVTRSAVHAPATLCRPAYTKNATSTM